MAIRWLDNDCYKAADGIRSDTRCEGRRQRWRWQPVCRRDSRDRDGLPHWWVPGWWIGELQGQHLARRTTTPPAGSSPAKGKDLYAAAGGAPSPSREYGRQGAHHLRHPRV